MLHKSVEKVAEHIPPCGQTFHDFMGRVVRLSPERWAHIQEHPEMANMRAALVETLVSPQTVVQSLSDPQAHLYYNYYYGTLVGNKYLCVVVKVAQRDAFVLTAYLTDTIKRGVVLWPKKS